MEDCCNVCDACLLPGELEANPRFGQDLCHFCAGEYAEANAANDVEMEA